MTTTAKIRDMFKGLFSIDDTGVKHAELDETYGRYRLSEHLLPAAYDEELGCYLCRDNTVGFLFECYPKPLVGEETIRGLQELFSSVFFPPQTVIQVTLWADDNLLPFSRRFQDLRKAGDGNFCNDVSEHWTSTMVEFLTGHRRNGALDTMQVPFRNFRLFFSCKLPYDTRTYRDKQAEISIILKNFKTSLEASYFFPEAMEPQHYIQVLDLMYNPNHDASVPTSYDPNQYIFRQVVSADTELAIGRKHVSYDGVHGKALTVKQFPEEVSVMDAVNFIGNVSRNELQITCPFILTMNLFIHTDKLKDGHMQKSEFLYKQKAASSLSVMLTKKQDESKWLIEKLVDGNRMMKGYVVWWLYHDDLDCINKNAQILRSLLSTKEYRIQEEIRTVNMGLMLAATPLNASFEIEDRLLKRSVSMFDFNAAHLTPCQGDWKGTGTPIIPFLSARGQAQFINVFDGSEGYNVVVAARTGSGKSFLIEHVVFSYYTLHDVSNIWVIDIGESYKIPCELVGGSYIDMRDDSDIVLNPFSDCDSLQDDIELLVRLYAKMAKPTEAANDTEKAVIEEAIKAAFDRRGRDTIVDDVIDELNRIAGSTSARAIAAEDPKRHAASVVATNLYRWSSQGSYGRFFNGRNSIDLSNKLVVLELKNLANREDLRNVVLMVLFYHMYRIIYVDDDRSKHKIIVFDEAHQFLGDPQVAKFIERLYRTLRKHSGSAITITQGLNDFYVNEGTRELLFQAAYWVLLPQKQESLELLRSESKISLSDYEFEQLTRLRTVKGQYSELFFFTPFGRGVGRLIVPKDLYWIYTTDPDEVSKRGRLIGELGLARGIKKCVELYGG